ncbi:SDR family NAD(P)-dependent oxidoreductase [Sphingomonas sp. TF3]|uniref:SDR family NAD(P)-dependent oxidoreductase n=1 Tax=Sphingomonas sp. TF3 TaxID=2495580 RepID=UPI001C8E5B93|nr:SDR family NAD(P)-dependent oxidoreductase [Sphingomonas sp. TF3]
MTSTVTIKPLPLVSTYRASKAAVSALTESLAIEMAPFRVRVHIVLPRRSPATQFGANAMPHLRGLDNADYKPLIEGMMKQFREDDGPVTHAGDLRGCHRSVGSAQDPRRRGRGRLDGGGESMRDPAARGPGSSQRKVRPFRLQVSVELGRGSLH